MTDCGGGYDNDAETLKKDRARITALVSSVSSDQITVIDQCTNGYNQRNELESEVVDYFVLNKASLQHQEALEQLLSRELSKRFSLVARNYEFSHNQGDQVFYEVSEMTLVVARVALPLGGSGGGDGDSINDIVFTYCCAEEAFSTTLPYLARKGAWLLLVFYAALHLWRLLDDE